MRIVMAGLVGQYALGGVVWDYLQYAKGFAGLGHDVWYVEDTLTWPYDPVADAVTEDASRNLNFLAQAAEAFGLKDRWAYRNGATGELHGLSEMDLKEVLQTAELFVNVSGATLYGRDHLPHAKLVHIDGDPMFHQIGLERARESEYTAMLERYDLCGTFGLSVRSPECRIPLARIDWQPMLQPIDLASWAPTSNAGASAAWTTIMNWSSYRAVEWENEAYGHKDREFLRFLELPSRSGQPFLIAMARGCDTHPEWQSIEAAGWQVIDPLTRLSDPQAYRQFIQSSRGEWSVAKHGYVAGKTGWFSGRTGCYLAAGRPCVVEDTGWSHHLPSGLGLLAFDTMEGAVSALHQVSENYHSHAKAARDLAAEYLDGAKICRYLIELAHEEKKS